MKITSDLILESLDEGVFCVDTNAIINFANSKCLKILGYKIEELINQSIDNIISSSSGTLAKENSEIYKSLNESIIVKNVKQTFWSKDKNPFYVEFTSTPITGNNGAVIIFREMPEEAKLLQKKQNIQDEYNKLKLSLLNAPAVICILSGPEHVYEFANDNYNKTLGYREIIGKTIREAMPEIAGQGFYEILDEVYKTGKPFVGNEVYSTIDKGNGIPEDVYWNFVYQPVFDDNSKIIGISNFSFDVTEQVLARRKLEELAENLKISEAKYRILSQELEIKVQERTIELAEANKQTDLEKQKLDSLFMNAPAMICVLRGPEHIYELSNPLYQNIIGERDILGKPIREALPELEGQGFYELLDNVYNTGKPFIGNEIPVNLVNNPDKIYMNFVYQPIYNLDGNIEGISVFAFNVTTLVLSRQRIEEFAKALEISNKELNNFAYVASHDLKTPIRSISGYAQLLEKRYKDKLDDSANDFIRLIVNNSNRMQNLIDDLLDHAKISTKSKEDVYVDLNNVIESVMLGLKQDIENNNASIIYNNLPVLKINENNMIRLFQNLISNSIKYRSKKNPVINIEAENKSNEWLFSVKDNGIGFDDKYSDRIFEIFQRLHNYEDYEGTGIGLANCKKIVELYSGKIWVESQEGKGSTFYFTLKI